MNEATSNLDAPDLAPKMMRIHRQTVEHPLGQSSPGWTPRGSWSVSEPR